MSACTHAGGMSTCAHVEKLSRQLICLSTTNYVGIISIEINITFICMHEGNIFTKDIIIVMISFDSLIFTRTYVSKYEC